MLLGEYKLKVEYLTEVLVRFHENDMLVNTSPSCRTGGMHNLQYYFTRWPDKHILSPTGIFQRTHSVAGSIIHVCMF